MIRLHFCHQFVGSCLFVTCLHNRLTLFYIIIHESLYNQCFVSPNDTRSYCKCIQLILFEHIVPYYKL